MSTLSLDSSINMSRPVRQYTSEGSGEVDRSSFERIGSNVILEAGVRVFHPENISFGENVYVGHGTILKGYHDNRLVIGDNTWIGQQCFIHSAGGVTIGKNVGIGPGVRIISSYHKEEGIEVPILLSDLAFSPVIIDDDVDLGVGAIILAGVHVGRGVQVGAGSVVTRDVPAYTVVAGVPAKVVRKRESGS